MDIRILTLLLLISIAGSSADLRSPFFRIRRNGLQETGKSHVTELVGMPRAKRESTAESTAKSTATPKPTTDATTTSAHSTSPTMTSTKKPLPKPRPAPKSNPITSSTTDSSSTPEPNPTTRSTSKLAPATKPTTKPASAKPKSTTRRPTTTTARPRKPTRAPRPTTASTGPPKPAVAATRAPRLTATSPRTPRPTTTSTTTPMTTTPTTKKPSDSDASKPEFSTESPAIGSRIDTSEEEPQESGKKPEEPSASKTDTQMGPFGGNPSQPGPQNLPFPSFSSFIPSFVPNFSPYNPYSDPLFNSIPGPNNYAWTGTNGGPAAASSFAGASAGSFAGPGYGKPMPVADRGAFVDSAPSFANVPNVANVPNNNYAPNAAFAGGYSNNGGGTLFDPNSFVFPGYNLDNLQKQMEENFKQLQAQFQQQQQALFETANRIGTDGHSGGPGGHTAVSSINLGPGGGYQAGAIHPAAPGVESRFGEDLPAPSGNSYGVFAGSSSRTVVGPDGKPVSHKISTTGVNDNGKITFRTVQD